jgi:hypothetical protein
VTTPESSLPAPTPPPPERSFGLIAVAALVVCGFVAGVLVAALLARQTQYEVTQLRTTVTSLQQDFERFRDSTRTLAASGDRHVVLSFADSGFQPIRTNGGTLLIALGEVKPLQNTVIVPLRIGNPQSVTYKNLVLTYEWDKRQKEEKFEHTFEPGQWTSVQLTLSPADPATTKTVRITSASVDQILVQ